jgi:hypothetical protein
VTGWTGKVLVISVSAAPDLKTCRSSEPLDGFLICTSKPSLYLGQGVRWTPEGQRKFQELEVQG